MRCNCEPDCPFWIPDHLPKNPAMPTDPFATSRFISQFIDVMRGHKTDRIEARYDPSIPASVVAVKLRELAMEIERRGAP